MFSKWWLCIRQKPQDFLYSNKKNEKIYKIVSNLLEEDESVLEVNNGKLEMQVNHFEIVSLKLLMNLWK